MVIEIGKQLEQLKNNEGLTLRNYKPIKYKTGYQVATEGKEAKTIFEAVKYIVDYKGCCGVWYSEGVYYIDKSQRVNTKKLALEIGKRHQQKSILKWEDMSLLWL